MSFVDFLDLVSVFSYKVRPSVQGRSVHVPHPAPSCLVYRGYQSVLGIQSIWYVVVQFIRCIA